MNPDKPMSEPPSSAPALDDIPFEIQRAIWGYAVLGDVLEFSALVSEKASFEVSRNHCVAWDRTMSYINSIERYHDGMKVPVPFYWALPCVTEQLIQREMATP